MLSYRVDQGQTCSMPVNLSLQERLEMLGMWAYVCSWHCLRDT